MHQCLGMKNKHTNIVSFEVQWKCHYDRGPLALTALKNALGAILLSNNRSGTIKICSYDFKDGRPTLLGYCVDFDTFQGFFSLVNKCLAAWLNDPRPLQRVHGTLSKVQNDKLRIISPLIQKTFFVGTPDWIRWQRKQAYEKFLRSRA